uniref:Fibronectin type-III domain-containing protein n=1 Tax=termite gut metagenome TaxID=433724 RepID=S0DDU0_9ZZZZ
MLTSSAAASGGSGPITYQWQGNTGSSPSWVDIANATGLTFQPSTLTSPTTYNFRRKTISGTATAYSNIVTITASYPTMSGGAIYLDGPSTITVI